MMSPVQMVNTDSKGTLVEHSRGGGTCLVHHTLLSVGTSHSMTYVCCATAKKQGKSV